MYRQITNRELLLKRQFTKNIFYFYDFIKPLTFLRIFTFYFQNNNVL